MNIFGHAPEKKAQLLADNELEATRLNQEVILQNEAIEKRCKEDEEKFGEVPTDYIGEYLKVTVLPVPSLDQRNEFQVFRNVMLNSAEKFDMSYFGESS